MSKKFDISNVRYELISSSHPDYKEVQVLFTHQGKEEKHFIFVKDEGKKNYIKEAKKIFKQDLKSGKVVQALKVTPGTKPWLVVSISVVAAAAIATASYFTYKYLNNPEPQPTPTPAVSHKFTFNGDCCMINGQYTYTHNIFEDDKNVQYTITPEEGYSLPTEVTGGVSYNPTTGVITISEIKEDVTVTAKGIELPPEPELKHTVHLNPNGGKLKDNIEVLENINDGDSIAKPELLDREGYDKEAVEWYKTSDFQESSKFDFDNDRVRGNLFLHAKWGSIQKCIVNFYEDNTETSKPQQVDYGSKPVYYTPDIPSGYEFLGWYVSREEDAAQFDFNQTITNNEIKAYAHWSEPTPVTFFQVHFDANGGELDSEAEETIDDIALNTNFYEITGIEKQIATKDNFDFVGWGLSKNTPDKIGDEYKIKDDITVYAIYTPKVAATVTFSNDSANCKLFYGEKELIPGVPCTVPATINITLKLVVNYDNYLPVFEEGLDITGDFTIGQFDVLKQEVVVSVSNNGNCNVKAVTNTPKSALNAYTWSEISQLSKMGLADTYFKVGDTKRVQLKHQDTAGDGADVISDGELYQTVRIIGFNEDYTELPIGGGEPDPTKAIGITFEFADLISDVDGYSLATYWKDADIASDIRFQDYSNSSIRKALNSSANDIDWFRFYGLNHDGDTNLKFATGTDYKKSIINMLPDSLLREDILKTPSKYTNVYTNVSSGTFEEKTVEDKLFLLSPVEMGRASHNYEEADTTAYSYYINTETAGDLRIKKQIKGADGARTSELTGANLDGDFSSTKFCFAGFNYQDLNCGGEYWSRSSFSAGSEIDNASFYIDNDGITYTRDPRSYALGIAPAFCI